MPMPNIAKQSTPTGCNSIILVIRRVDFHEQVWVRKQGEPPLLFASKNMGDNIEMVVETCQMCCNVLPCIRQYGGGLLTSKLHEVFGGFA